MPVPNPIATLFSYFPLHTFPPITPQAVARDASTPTLWIAPPLSSPTLSVSSEDRVLSSDVECLKWQAYIALRGLKNLKVRWDVAAEGALEGRLPNLHLPKADAAKLNADLNPTEENPKADAEETLGLYAARLIPSWVDLTLGFDSASDALEGYKDVASRDESRAWVALLEGVVHAALLISLPQQVTLAQLLGLGYSSSSPSPSTATSKPSSQTSSTLQTVLSPPPAPLTGFTSLLPSFGTRVSRTSVISQYVEAIASLSERLGTDQWFLGSSQPTPLDALAFAYLHCILVHAKEPVRVEVTKRVNLVAWEWRVRSTVRGAYSL
ncbi:hypothetical protein DFP72DRAFT_488260 [Ephemerocybe angulata]|uniref:Metaxin glutathione S-transferase domain-containing protein n=1 Tax=Ephemerocybe angulata TaxID=980116 RepID=A0A8H6MCA5_9AGAR|nr:hypothetical protein DFP72DRAFT_488260 [Tulosesus angulatus]